MVFLIPILPQQKYSSTKAQTSISNHSIQGRCLQRSAKKSSDKSDEHFAECRSLNSL